MDIREHENLKDKTTLKIPGTARYYIETEHIEEAVSFAESINLPVFVLGGGSNIVLPKEEIMAVVMRPTYTGFEVEKESEESLLVKVGAGEHLDSFIQTTVDRGWWGLENLSWIPGTVAGLAVQNAGAYGVEASDHIQEVHVFDTKTKEYKVLSHDECSFGYRRSIFNTTEKGRYIITHITLMLSKKPIPVITYRSLETFKTESTQQELRNGIIAIRDAKDLDPNRVWSVGSFFKNVEVEDISQYNLSEEVIKKLFKTDAGYKIPSAALIEDLGLKGFCVGDACVSETQANMLINKGGATSAQIHELFTHVVEEVENKTGVRLVQEPEFL